MPVYKYRSAEAMQRPEPISGPELAERIRTAWRRAFLLCPPEPRRGVRRFRTMGEANDDRLRLTIERMRRTRR
jgi:hypothetical protein